jgi:23S rRNA pseudouridine1911/1915/1917 synthase
VPKADLVVGPEAGSGARLDVFLADRIEGLSRAQVRKVIDAGGVRVGSYARKAGYKLKPGDRVHAEYEVPEPEGALIPQNIPLKIIIMDADVIVIDKPPNLVVHPGPGHPSGTLVNALIYHFPEVAKVGHEDRPGIVHRLDQDTSGVMVVARSPRAWSFLTDQFKRRVVWKTYLALAWGRITASRASSTGPSAAIRKEGRGCR